ncbi:MAG: hypothetical protein WBP26_00585 [Candidatus Saccharimonadales bacterium]
MIPSQPIEALRYVSLLALGVVLLAGLWVLISAKHEHGSAASISERLSGNRQQFITMALFLTLLGAVFYSSMYWWLAPTYHLPVLFYIILSIAYIAQLVLAWTPYSGKSERHTQLHTHGGEFVACAMGLSMVLVFAGNHTTLPFFSYWITLTSIIFSVIAIALYIGAPKMREHFVVYESIYILLFAGAIVTLTLKI